MPNECAVVLDIMEVDNRVVLNIGGIRHQVYKVRLSSVTNSLILPNNINFQLNLPNI